MRAALRTHWPEYLMEAAGLGMFMVSAGLFTTIFEYPGSPVRHAIASALIRRAWVGLAMGLTAVGLIYSPWGQQSGAHYNPAVTLSFLRLGRVRPWDAAFYTVFQFLGGWCGVALVSTLLGDKFRQQPVDYVTTVPGSGGPWIAFLAEVAISFGLMAMVLLANSVKALTRYTGWLAGFLICVYVTLEAPLSGMSMNPARTFASAAPAGRWDSLWIYFAAPVIGMLLAVEASRVLRGGHASLCAKLHHGHLRRCIHCGARTALLLLLTGSPLLRAQVHAAAVGAIVLPVADLDRSVDFYTRVLSFRMVSEKEAQSESFDRLTGIFGTNVRVANLRLGEEGIELVEFRTPPGRPMPQDSRSDDGWFQHVAIVVRDMDAACARLREHKAPQISTAPQTLPAWNRNAAGIQAFYFRDPDNHPLELIHFPADKGDPRWQAPNSAPLFLGIDHTAIAVRDTDRSLSFYRDLLGFRVAGESLNYGAEQEQLNHVFGSRVRITSLRAPAGPGIEFLEYLTPRTGRPYPRETAANDLWASETTVFTSEIQAGVAGLEKGKVEFVSSGAQDLTPLSESGVLGILVRDPDGHAVLLRSR